VKDARRLPGGLSELTPAEYRADATVQVAGLLLGIVGSTVLLATAPPRTSPWQATALAAYAIGLVAMLGCSALYRLTRDPVRKHIFRRLDHAAIFLMIAGTYTPLIVNGGRHALFLLALVWLVALAGMAIKLLALPVPEKLSVGIYLALGWTILLAPGEVFALPAGALALLVMGGLLYSIGVLFYLWEQLRFHVAIWHGFVLAAAACHYIAIMLTLPV
jgi:hemolysin III